MWASQSYTRYIYIGIWCRRYKARQAGLTALNSVFSFMDALRPGTPVFFLFVLFLFSFLLLFLPCKGFGVCWLAHVPPLFFVVFGIAWPDNVTCVRDVYLCCVVCDHRASLY